MPPATRSPAHRPYTAISPKAFEHPADRAATAVLHKIPFFDALVKRLLEFRIERALMQLLLGNAVRVGENQLPNVWGEHRACYAIFDIDTVAPLYAYQWPLPNGMAVGAHRPTVLVTSSAVNMLDMRELRALLAHEAGHVLSEHVRYRTTLEILLRLTVPRLPLIGNAALQALRMALLAWFRATELSCDRAAAIALRDPLVPCSLLLKMAGGVQDDLNLDAFVQQSADYVEWDDLFDRYTRLGPELGTTHPFPVRRVHELTRWVQSGEYDRIISGDYVRRGEEPPVSEEFTSAVEHYTVRFRELIDRTGVGIDKLSKQLSQWVNSWRGNDEEDAAEEEEGPPTRRRPRGGGATRRRR
ncbi:MAG: M48 family metallopeptidase [Candidatus Dormibacteraeota bacterium]|nr:M48 family metallopeptidase [Candidatus Dormibacteraeota bacterium]